MSEPSAAAADRHLLVFTKPARPGRVKTRLIGDLTAGQAAQLHAAFLGDVVERMAEGSFRLSLAWALEAGEQPPRLDREVRDLPDSLFESGNGRPGGAPESVVQVGDDLGERLFNALRDALGNGDAQGKGAEGGEAWVAVIGSDHPGLPLERVNEAFERLDAGAPLVLGPAVDGGYYLLATGVAGLRRVLFEDIPWSTAGVLEATLQRCRAEGMEPALLEPASDVDTPEDLRGLAERMARAEETSSAEEVPDCPRTRRLLQRWDFLPGTKGERTR